MDSINNTVIKECGYCGKYKPIIEFNKRTASKDGLQNCCKDCNIVSCKKYYGANASYRRQERKDYYIKNRDTIRSKKLIASYGISLEERNKLLQLQNNKCAICGIIEDNKLLEVDHCHKIQKIRGLLCTKCNKAIGLFNDDPTLLRSAIEYLEKCLL